MALRKGIAKFPSARDPVILSILSLYPVIPSKEALRKRTRGVTARKICTIVGSNFGVSAKADGRVDRKSTRLNSSHEWISYAVFCLKKKKRKDKNNTKKKKKRRQKLKKRTNKQTTINETSETDIR